MLTTVIVLVILYVIYKEFAKLRATKKSEDAIRADLSIIELNAIKMRQDLYERGDVRYDDVQRMYEIETLAKGLNKELAGGATAKTGTRAH